MNWKKLKTTFANAFAYDDGRSEITPDDVAMLDRVADFVVRRHLTTPAILILESTGPLNFVGSSLMTFFRPIFGAIFNTTEYERVERLLEKRCSMRVMVERIELRERQHKATRHGPLPPERTFDGPPPDEPPADKIK
jgi:hypothetical protein